VGIKRDEFPLVNSFRIRTQELDGPPYSETDGIKKLNDGNL
jgi:hypothetical protein